MMDAIRPTFSTAAPNPPARGKKPADASFSFPPICSASALVLMMYRIGFAGAGELITELMYGLDQPQIPAQFAPAQLFAAGCAVTAVASWLSAARILSDIAAEPVFTTRIPSGPTETVMFVPSATSM